MTARESQATALWTLLGTGAKLPPGSTKEITVDARLAGRIARELGMPPEQAYRALYGEPVRAVYQLYAWSLRVEPDSPGRALVNAVSKNAKARASKQRGAA